MSHDEQPQLAGRRVVLAGARKGEEFTGPLERRGVDVTVAAALSYVDLADDHDLHAAIRDLIADPPDLLIMTTGVGWRGVLQAARTIDLESAFLDAVRSSRVFVRGAKARGGAQGSGLAVSFCADSETSAELITRLAAEDLAGRRVAIQHHGSGSADLDDAVSAAGGQPVDLIAYRTAPAPDPTAVSRAIVDVIAGQVDVLAFTSAPLFTAYVQTAEADGNRQEFVDALRDGRCQVAGFGELTVKPMLELGLTPLIPERSRLGALVKSVVAHLEATAPPSGTF